MLHQQFWTAEEVSNYLRIPQSTIYKLAQDKVLPGFKVGKHWRFRRETILEWVKEKENLVHQNNNLMDK